MINRNRAAILTAVILIVVGALCAWLRIRYTLKPVGSQGGMAWRLTYDISLSPTKEGRIHIAMPDSTPYSRLFQETFSHQGVWADLLRNKRTRERGASVVSMAGHERGRFFARFDIHLKPDQQSKSPAVGEKMSVDDRAYYLRPEKDFQITSPGLSSIMNQLANEQMTKTELLTRIFDYCAENIIKGEKDTFSDATNTLEHGFGNTLGRARAMVALCRVFKIPARVVAGFVLENTQEAQVHYWVEVFSEKKWLSYDPENGYSAQVPITFLPVSRDSTDIVRGPDTLSYQSRYSIRRLLPFPSWVSSQDSQLWNIVDLARLPPSMQEIVSLILLLPVAALITTIFRNIIGIQTFGTFTPSLIALSFIHADWHTGTMVLFIVLSVGILARLLLNKLQLLMVARLSIILTLAVLCMVLAVSVLDYLSMTPSASAVLLPIVILTMMIERFNIIAEEDGLPNALKILATTFLVAVCCFLVMKVELISRLVLIFPEVQLFNVAILLLIGRYSGYRLSEIWRFRDITQIPFN